MAAAVQPSLLMNIADMIDLSIGSPECGIVDFNMLHTVLHCLAQQMRVLEKNVEIHGDMALTPVGDMEAMKTIQIEEYEVQPDGQDSQAMGQDTLLMVEKIPKLQAQATKNSPLKPGRVDQPPPDYIKNKLGKNVTKEKGHKQKGTAPNAQVTGMGQYAQGPGAGPNAQGPGTGPYAIGPGTGPNAQGPGMGPTAQGTVEGQYAQGPGTGPNAQGTGTGQYAQGPNAQGTVGGQYAQGPGTGPNVQGTGTGQYAQGPNAQGTVGGQYAQGPGTGQYTQGPTAQGTVEGQYAQGPGTGPNAQGTGTGQYAQGPNAQGTVGGQYAQGPGTGQYTQGPGTVEGQYAQGPGTGPNAQGTGTGQYAQGPNAQGTVGGQYAQGPGTGQYAQGPGTGPYAQGQADEKTLSLVTMSKFNLLQQTVGDLQKRVYGSIPKNEEMIEEVRSQTNLKSITDMWTNMNVSSRLEAAETAINRLSSLLEDVIADNNTLREAIRTCQSSMTALDAVRYAIKDANEMNEREAGRPGGPAESAPAVPISSGAKAGVLKSLAPGAVGDLSTIQGAVLELREDVDKLADAYSNMQNSVNKEFGNIKTGIAMGLGVGGGGGVGGVGLWGPGGGGTGGPGGVGTWGPGVGGTVGPGGGGAWGPGGGGAVGPGGVGNWGPGGGGTVGPGGGGTVGPGGGATVGPGGGGTVGPGGGGTGGPAGGGPGAPGAAGAWGPGGGGPGGPGGGGPGGPGAVAAWGPGVGGPGGGGPGGPGGGGPGGPGGAWGPGGGGTGGPVGGSTWGPGGGGTGGPGGGGTWGPGGGGTGGAEGGGTWGPGGGGTGGGGAWGPGGGGTGGPGGGGTLGPGGPVGGGPGGPGGVGPGGPGGAWGPGGGGTGGPGVGGTWAGGQPANAFDGMDNRYYDAGAPGAAWDVGKEGAATGSSRPTPEMYTMMMRMNDIDNRLRECCDNMRKYTGNMSDQIINLEDQVEGLLKQVATLTEGTETLLSKDMINDLKGLMELFHTVQEMQQELKQVHETALQLAAEKENRQQNLNAIVDQIELLKTIKMDREDILEAMAEKADLTAVARKVSFDQFEGACDDLSKGLDHALGKLGLQEAIWQQALDDIQRGIESKLDKVELMPVKDFFNTKLRELQNSLRQIAILRREAEAAGTKRKLLRDVNCISCDAKACMNLEPSPAAVQRPFPATLSMKPYLSYELDTIRKTQQCAVPQRNLHDWEQMEKQTKVPRKVRSDTDKHICNRYCGGSHTRTTASQRVARTGHFMKQWGPDVLPLSSGMAAGDDGRMYKISVAESASVGPAGAAPKVGNIQEKGSRRDSYQRRSWEMSKRPSLHECRCLDGNNETGKSSKPQNPQERPVSAK